jgi:hypothetical protein
LDPVDRDEDSEHQSQEDEDVEDSPRTQNCPDGSTTATVSGIESAIITSEDQQPVKSESLEADEVEDDPVLEFGMAPGMLTLFHVHILPIHEVTLTDVVQRISCMTQRACEQRIMPPLTSKCLVRGLFDCLSGAYVVALFTVIMVSLQKKYITLESTQLSGRHCFSILNNVPSQWLHGILMYRYRLIYIV